MDVDRIEAMEAQWMEDPPVSLLVAHFLGYKKKEKKADEGIKGVQELLAMFPDGRVGV